MRYPFLPFLVLIAPFWWPGAASAKNNCPGGYAVTVVSLQGKLYYLPEKALPGRWQEARLNDSLCEGSRLKVGAYSRATIKYPNDIFIRLDQNTLVVLKEVAVDQPTWLSLLKGFLHTISRTPKRLTIETPIANAGPEGTEFAMSVDDNKASLWVYEGGVKFYNDKGSVKLLPGQGAQTLLGQAPQARIDIKPQDAVNWALYYPPVLPYPDKNQAIDSDLRAAIDAFRQGHIDDALARMDAISPPQQTPYYLTVRAAMRLTVGLDKLALQDIQTLLAEKPNDAEALALQSVMALTQNRKDEAYALAKRAVSADPNSSAAYSALSYSEQGRFDLDKALTAAQKAAKLAPHDGMTWARLAELELSQGKTSGSEEAAQKAIQQDANLERTQTVLGFSYLSRMDAEKARQAFEKATQMDSTSPLARLGLGLAKIRGGELEEGRQDLETAAILDPNNAIVRSYLGKAYYEERRPKMADEQFKLAKERDPKDPTPYFYDAINKQTTNRPVEALHDMQKAIELNDNRGVYRSKFLLDKDEAARTANLSRIYNDLGFGRVALKQAWNALGYDSTNPTAHRFLSDAYIGQPRYRVARASELLQAQLLQPINITPVQPQLTGENIGILNSTGPGTLSVNEYDPLYNANGAHVVLNGAYGSNNSKTDNAIISGIYNNFSGSLGQFHYQTDGFRKNDAYQQEIYNAFAQYVVTPDFNAQVEIKSERLFSNDLPMRLNGYRDENYKKTIKQDNVRIGGHYRINSEQNAIVSAIYTTRNEKDTNISSRKTGFQTEGQYLFRPASFDIIFGLGYSDVKDNNTNISERFYNAYLYSKHYLHPNLTTILGLGFDSFHDEESKDKNRDQFSPKFGILWNPFKKLTLRSAAFRTLNRPLTTNQTIEPTQIAGFNQFFDDQNGNSAWQYALGIDYSPVNKLFIGGEAIWRNAHPYRTRFKPFVDGTHHLAYMYWVLNDFISFKAEYRYDKIAVGYANNDRDSDLNFPVNVVSQHVPLSVIFFHPNGLFAKVSANYINQHAFFDTETNVLDRRNTDFWTLDTSLGYRLPKKIGIISIEVRNLLDRHFSYQSVFDASGPQLSPFIPERQFFAKLSLFY